MTRLLIVAAALCAGALAHAQDTRTAVITEEQAEKAKRLGPYEMSKAERIFTRAMRSLTEAPTGFYPAFGSIYPGGIKTWIPLLITLSICF